MSVRSNDVTHSVGCVIHVVRSGAVVIQLRYEVVIAIARDPQVLVHCRLDLLCCVKQLQRLGWRMPERSVRVSYLAEQVDHVDIRVRGEITAAQWAVRGNHQCVSDDVVPQQAARHGDRTHMFMRLPVVDSKNGRSVPPPPRTNGAPPAQEQWLGPAGPMPSAHSVSLHTFGSGAGQLCTGACTINRPLITMHD